MLFGSKILAIIFCLYYIFNAHKYQVSWTLLNYVAPSMTLQINRMLSFIGTFILIIPLSILTTSLLIPENTRLHILSSLFGIATFSFSTIRAFMNQSLGETSDFKLFTVTHILKLQEKRDLFLMEFKRLVVENYTTMIKTYTYLMSKLEEQDFVIYDSMLNQLNTTAQIKLYASDTVVQLVNVYQATLTPKTFWITPTTIQVIIGVAGFFLFCYAVTHIDNLTGLWAGAKTALGLHIKAQVIQTEAIKDMQSLSNNIMAIQKALSLINGRLNAHDVSIVQTAEAIFHLGKKIT